MVLVIREDDNDYKHHLMRPSQGVTNLLLPDDDDDDGPDRVDRQLVRMGYRFLV